MTEAERNTRDRIIRVLEAYLASAVNNEDAIDQLMEIQASSKELGELLSALQFDLDGLVGRRIDSLSPRRRRGVTASIEQVLLFLRSDFPYRHAWEIERDRKDPIPTKRQLLWCLLTLGSYHDGIPAPAKESCWPFATQAELRQCLARQGGVPNPA